MEKILMVLDGGSSDHSNLTFGRYLSSLTGSKITGIFLENRPEDQHPVLKKMYDGTYLEWEVDEESKAWKEKMRRIDQGIEQFRAFYAGHNIATSVHRDKGLPLKELMAETRYADVMVINAAVSFKNEDEELPTSFVEELLAKAESPVVIAPVSFNGIEEIVFAWDGSQSSTFAIKLFTYLFPRLSDKKVIIAQAEKGETYDEDLNRIKMQEWLEHHYGSIEWEELPGKADTALFGYLLNKEKVFIVFGAYGRNMASRFFRHSHAEKVIQTTTQPIFIAHY